MATSFLVHVGSHLMHEYEEKRCLPWIQATGNSLRFLLFRVFLLQKNFTELGEIPVRMYTEFRGILWNFMTLVAAEFRINLVKFLLFTTDGHYYKQRTNIEEGLQ